MGSNADGMFDVHAGTVPAAWLATCVQHVKLVPLDAAHPFSIIQNMFELL